MNYYLIWRLLGAVLLLASNGNAWAQSVAPNPAQAGSNLAAAQTAEQPALGTAQAPQRQIGYIDLVAGLAYTSNALLTSSPTIASGIAVAGTTADYGYQGADLATHLLGTVNWVEYLHRSIDNGSSGLPSGASQSFEGEPYGQLTGTALLGRSTDPLQWQLSDGFGEQMANPLAAPTPQAREWVNYVTTGPDINLNFALRDRLTLFGQYSRTTYQTSPYDSQGYNAGVLLTHGLSAVSALSFLVSTAHTEFLKAAELASVPGAMDSYDIRTATLGYNATFARTQITASAGYNAVSYLEAGSYPRSSQGRPTGALQLSRQISPSASLYLKGQDAYESSGSSLLSPPAGVAASAVGATPAALMTVLPATQSAAINGAPSTLGLAPAIGSIATGIPQAGFGVVTGVAVAAPFEERAGTLGWAFQHARTGLSLTGTAMQERFLQQSTFDLNAWIASAGWLRQLTPTLAFQVQGFHSFYHFTQLHADTHSSIVGVTLAKQLARVTFSAYAEWLHQSSSVPPGITLPIALYSNELVGVNVSYDLIGSRLTGQ